MQTSDVGRDGALGYRPALDGLRAVAVAAVLAFHSDFGFATGGYLGVSAFFTLSGFLITTLLLAEHRDHGRISLVAFWARRARRLLPASLLGVALAAAYVWFAAPPSVVEAFRGDGIAALANLANWRFVLSDRGYLDTFALATGGEGAPSPVLHYWSLAIEEQFYLVFPLGLAGLLAVTRRRLDRVAVALGALTVASFVLGWWLGGGPDNSRAYFGTDTRAVELLVGALLAVAFVRRGSFELGPRAQARVRRAAIGAVVLLGTAWATIDHDHVGLFRGLLLAHAVLVAVVIAAALQPSWMARALGVRPLVAIGRVSYGLYVFHWPIFRWIDAGTWGLDGVLLHAVRLAVTATLTIASYRLLEQPVRTGRLGRAARRAAIPAWLAVAGLVVVAWTAPDTTDTVFSPVAATDDRLVIDGKPAAEDAANGRILVVGDSVALTLGRGIERWGADNDAAVWNAARMGCGIPRAPISIMGKVVDSTVCKDWAEMWAELVAGFDPDVAIVFSPVWDGFPHRAPGWDEFRQIGDPVYDAWLLDEYRTAVDTLSAGGARVVWLDVPCNEGDELGRDGGAVNAVLARLAEARPRLELVSLADRLCDATGDFAAARSDDGYHFTETGADLVGGWLMDQLSRPGAPEGAR